MNHGLRAGCLLLTALLAAAPGEAPVTADEPPPPPPPAEAPAPPPPTDPEREAQLEQAKALFAEARELAGKRQLPEALARAEASLALRERLLGPAHADLATSLTLVGEMHRLLGQAAKARPYYQRALAMREGLFGPESSVVASSINNLAAIERDDGKLAAARPLFERAIAILVKLHGPEHEKVLVVRGNLGQLLSMQGELAAARVELEQVVAIRERLQGAEHRLTALAMRDLAGVLRTQAEYEASRTLYQRALTALERSVGPEHPEVAYALVGLAGTLMDQGLYAEARPLLARALAVTTAAFGPDHPYVAASSSNYAEALRKQGDYAEARALYERALAIAIKVHGEDHPNVVAVLTNLGILLTEQGAYVEARERFERALATQGRTPALPALDRAATLYNFALLLQAQGLYAEARVLHERALALRLEVLDPEHPGIALSLNNMALILHAQGQYEEARPLYERALRLREKAHGPDHPEVARICNNLAALCQQQGLHQEARALYERARAIWERTLGRDHPDFAVVVANLAWLLRVEGELDAARTLQEESLLAFERTLGATHPRVSGGEFNLALVLDLKGSVAEARLHFERALALTEQEVRRRVGSLTARERLVATQLSRQRLEGWLAFAPKVGSVGYEEVLRVKGMVGRVEAAERMLGRRGSAEDLAHDARLHEVERQLGRLANQVPPARRSEARAAWQAQYAAAGAERERLARELAQRVAPLREAWERLDLRVGDVRASLEPDEALVDLLRVGDRYLAWVVRRTGDLQRVDLGAAGEIEAACQAFLREIATRAPSPTPSGARLRALIWAPIEARLGAGVRALWIAPDAALAGLPWAALPGRQPGSFVLDELSIGCVMHAFDLVPDATRGRGGQGALLVGGVDYDRASAGEDAMPAPPRLLAHAGQERAPQGGSWRPLAGTLAEVEALRDRLGADGATVLLGAQATEARVRAAVAGRRLVHVATHGFAREDLLEGLELRRLPDTWTSADVERQVAAGHDPMLLSGLVLAGANPREGAGGDDGILTALEASYLPLDGADLVTLSACETARGTAASGEGVLGLVRAFQMAGARCVLASLWKVDDEATRLLMQGVDEGLLQADRSLSPAEALRRAALALRERAAEGGARSYADARHWAAFVAYGR